MVAVLSSDMSLAQLKAAVEADLNVEFAYLIRFAAPGAVRGNVSTLGLSTGGNPDGSMRYVAQEALEFDTIELCDDQRAYEAWLGAAAYKLIGVLERAQGQSLMSFASGNEVVSFEKEAFRVVFEPLTLMLRPLRGAVSTLLDATLVQHVGIEPLDANYVQLRSSQVA